VKFRERRAYYIHCLYSLIFQVKRTQSNYSNIIECLENHTENLLNTIEIAPSESRELWKTQLELDTLNYFEENSIV